MLTPIELDVLEGISAQSPGHKLVLNQQLSSIVEVRRSYSGAGYFAEFKLDGDFKRFEQSNFELGDLAIEMDDLEHGATAILFVRQGRISFLEFASYEEEWPTEIKNYRVSDANTKPRIH